MTIQDGFYQLTPFRSLNLSAGPMPVQVTVAILGCFAGSAALMTAFQSEFRDLRKSLQVFVSVALPAAVCVSVVQATFLILGFFACRC